MKVAMFALSVAGLASLSSPASAQSADFNLTYHVERTSAAKLSIETCGRIATQVARQSKLSAESQSFPRQLVLVKGGNRGTGIFTVQCIAVGTTTVSVVQGIDYREGKGALGNYADKVFASLKLAAK